MGHLPSVALLWWEERIEGTLKRERLTAALWNNTERGHLYI